MPDGRVDQKQKQSRAERALRDQRILVLELSRLGRRLGDQVGMRGRGGQTSPGSGQKVVGTYREAFVEALRLCVGASVGRAVEQDL